VSLDFRPLSGSIELPRFVWGLKIVLAIWIFSGSLDAWGQCDPAVVTITSTGSGSWPVPAGVTSITVEVWGGGGRGGSRTSSSGAYGGGGGGAYSRAVLTVNPGQTYAYVVGAGSTSTTAGGTSRFYLTASPANDLVRALGGNSVNNNSSTGAAGGLASGGVGDVRYSGGRGANATTGNNSPSSNRVGGGGGSSAGTNADGTNATGIAGALAPAGGGNGGNGINGDGNGVSGTAPGGGGGGAERTSGNRVGGSGGNGQIRITYTPPSPTAGAIAGAQTVCSGDDPAAFTNTTSGTGAGTISYRWEHAVSPFTTWTSISGATSSTYNVPSGLTATTQYRRITIATSSGSTCESNPTAPIQVTVQSVPTSGAIAGAQSICSGDDPAPFTSSTPGNGAGTISYKWERAVSPFTSWTTIGGATSATYDAPSGLTVTTQYRRTTISTLNGASCESAPTAPVQVSINPIKSAPAQSATVCVLTEYTDLITHTTSGVTGIGTALNLPPGLTASFSGGTITISGTPSQLGTYNYSIPLLGSCGPDAFATGTIIVENCACEEIFTEGSSDFVIPAGVTSITVEAWGGGGKGSTRSTTGSGGGGGGGGYSRSLIPVSPGQTYTYVVGAGSSSTAAGGNSQFYLSTTPGTILVSALGGSSAADNNATGAAGGGIGIGNQATYAGGRGASGGTNGGGGGSSAGTAQNGNYTSSTFNQAGATAPPGGGNGANGRAGSSGSGNSANAVGGGGGGARRDSGTTTYQGGNGANGQIKITYNLSAGNLSGNRAVCVGGNSTFTSTISGGIWSSSNPAIATINPSTGVITGVGVGSATMTYSVTGSCAIATATRTVVVNQPINPAVLSGIQELCVGGTTTFTSNTTNGVWSSSNPSLVTVSSTGLVTAIAVGTATISYTLPSSGGCPPSVSTRTVTVTAPPNAGILSGLQEVCVGSATLFSSTILGGTWSSNNTSVASINASTGEVIGIASGTATMTYTVAGTGGCANSIATRTVTVSAPPTAGTLSGMDDLCIGDDYTFTSSVLGGMWSSDDILIATVNSVTGLVTAVAPGTATITYTVNGTGGCANVSTSRQVTVQPLPVPTFTTQSEAVVCIDELVSYETQPDMEFYEWSIPGVAGVDFEIESGGTESDHIIILRWKTAGNKSVGINYGNAFGCAADSPTFSDITIVQANTAIDSQNFDAQIICDGGDFTEISVDASGPGTLHYQWYKNTSPTTSGGTPVGTDSDNYLPLQSDFAAIGDGNPLYYYVVVSHSDGCGDPVTSSISGKFVVKSLVQIIDHPDDSGEVECFGDGFSPISVNATGSNLTYQWYSNATQTNTGGTAILGATSAEFTPNSTLLGSNYYYVVVTGHCEAKTSEVSGEFIVTPPETTITQDLTSSAPDLIRCIEDHTFPELSIEAIGEGTVSYQWYRNNVPTNIGGSLIPGETGPTFTPLASIPGVWYYYATASSDCGTVPTNVSGAYVVNPITEIEEENLSGQTVCEGEDFDPISVVANAGFPDYKNTLTYQWYSNTVSSYTGPDLVEIVGANDAFFTPSSDVAGSTLYYFVTVSGPCGPEETSSISGSFHVTPNQTVDVASSSPEVCVEVAIPNITHSTANATGIGTPSSLPAGVTASFDQNTQTITISGTPTISGVFNYSIPVLGCLTSGIDATGTIAVNPKAVITSVIEINVCSEEEFEVIPTDGTNGAIPTGTTFSWSAPSVTGGITGGSSGNGSSIVGTLINTTSSLQTATYTVTPNSGDCSGSTFEVKVTVHPRPDIADITVPAVCSGDAITVIPTDGVDGIVPSGTTYTWTVTDNPNVAGETSQATPQTSFSQVLTQTTSTSQTVVYTVTPRTANGCEGDSFTIEVVVQPIPTVNPIPNQAAVCSGESSTVVNFSGNGVAGVVYNWTNSNPSIGLPASGSGNIPAFTTVNTGTSPVTATITVTPQANGCNGPSQTFTITVNPSPIVTVLADYCAADGNVELVASSSVPGTTWLWNTGETSSSIFVDEAGLYSVTATSPSGCSTSSSFSVAQELVVNGNFSQGNTGFTTGYSYVVNSANPAVENELWDEGRYSIGTDARNYHTNFWGIDHTNNAVGNRNMMIVNGYPGTNNTTIWQQTVNVRSHSEYYFSAWAMSLNTHTPYARLQFEVNGQTVGTIGELGTGPGNAEQALNSANYWIRFHSGDNPWYSGDYEGPITIRIVNLETAAGGNDFALDDISFGTLSTFITLTSAAGTDASQVVCEDSPIEDITYSVGGGIEGPVVEGLPAGVNADWNGVTLRLSGSPTVSGTFEYTVVTTGACLQKRASGIIVVRGTPAAGSITNDQTVCSGEDPALLSNVIEGTGDVGSDITYRWESNSNLTTPNWTEISGQTQATYDPPVLAQTTQYRRITIATLAGLSCESEPTAPVQITVQNIPTPGSISSDQTICNGNIPVTFSSPTDGTGDGVISYRWESAVSPFNSWTPISGAASASYSPSEGLTATTRYRRITISTLNNAACESEPTAFVQVTVTPNNIVEPQNPDLTLCVDVNFPSTIIHRTTGVSGIIPESATIDYNLPNGATPVWTPGSLPGEGVLTISGTPVEMGIFNYNIPLSGGCGDVSATGTITVENPSYPITSIAVENPLTLPGSSTFKVYSSGLTPGIYTINYSTDGINGGPDQTIQVEVTIEGEFTIVSPAYSQEGTTILTINSIQKSSDACPYFPPNNNTVPYGVGCHSEFLQSAGDNSFYVPADVFEVTIQAFGDGSAVNSGSAAVIPGGVIYIVVDGNTVFATKAPASVPMADRRAQAIVSATGPNGIIVINYECNNPQPCGAGQDQGYQYVDSEGYTVIRFNVGACNWYAPDGLDEFEILVVGAGGGGGFGNAAGGGGGGAVIYRHYTGITMNGLPGLQGAIFPLSVGDRGLGANSEVQGGNGEESTFAGPAFSFVGGNIFSDIMAPGGGGGGSTSLNSSVRQGAIGASGGGGAASGTNESSGGVGLFGSNGGNGYGETDGIGGGGGGGAHGLGNTAINTGDMLGGTGGSGVELSISGEPIFYGAGGGGTSSGAIVNHAGEGGSPYISGGINYFAGGSGSNHDLGQSATTYGSGGGAGRLGGGAGFPGVIYIRYPNFRILPVEYLYFNATYNPILREATLSWATSKEWENSHFEIERSVNGLKSWTKIGEVDGQGYADTPSEYQFIDDELPLSGGNIYYRLKQVDIDGDATYSNTRSILVERMRGTTYWRVYPNPSTGDQVNLEMLDSGLYDNEPVSVRVISATGQFDVIQSRPDVSLGDQVSAALRNKASGLYTLEISWGMYKEYHKLVLRR
jgi:uncharacterized protein YjdB